VKENNMKKKIVAVDDDQGILEVLKIALETEDYDVTPVGDVDLVISTIERVKPDLVLLDMLLSGMDGRDIARKLKANEHTNNIPIVMLSAHPTADKTTIEAGANDFLSKPFDIDDLLAMVKKYVG
jgi:DNA-binding response OmpR family regulator